ncbi:hypothetical protein [Bacteroides acidifaciens]|uniref:hypothetical protein n=1 Tax=Bacteroides acidifaciens TaxID=85831 RepID=UPI00158DBDA5|nr:hypothetical protein [Bacteroides acidifaciens]
MEYIDKTTTGTAGEAIIDAFLKRLQEAGKYPNDLYEAFKSDKDENGNYSKDKLIKTLLAEQENRCCYCMKKLDQNEDEITLEHLILNSITEREKYNDYLKRETVLSHKVCLAKEFIDKNEVNTPPYPHTVAYENLTASCNGKFFSRSESVHCCNLKRGNKYIRPIVLYSTIHDEFEYKNNGYAIWKNETDTLPLTSTLGLNDPILRMIRRIWLHVKTNQIDLEKTERQNVLNGVLGQFTNEEFSDINNFNILYNFQNDGYWNLFLKYSYFYSA